MSVVALRSLIPSERCCSTGCDSDWDGGYWTQRNQNQLVGPSRCASSDLWLQTRAGLLVVPPIGRRGADLRRGGAPKFGLLLAQGGEKALDDVQTMVEENREGETRDYSWLVADFRG